MPSKRKHEEIDVYYLAYGRDYFACLRDFYKLSGAVPLLPRYALGNWWSRYWKYSEESYIELLTEFEKRNIPFSVAVMDMDWHIVDVPDVYKRQACMWTAANSPCPAAPSAARKRVRPTRPPMAAAACM